MNLVLLYNFQFYLESDVHTHTHTHTDIVIRRAGPYVVRASWKANGYLTGSTGGFRSSREEESHQERRLQLQMMINLLLAVKCRLSPCGWPEQKNDDRMDAPRRSRRLLNFIYWASSNSSSFTAILVYVRPSSAPQNPCEIIGKNVAKRCSRHPMSKILLYILLF